MVGPHDDFDMEAARSVMRSQWRAEQYRDNADLPGHRYSRARMLDVLQQRCEYVIRRGATLNNPHITRRDLTGPQKIRHDQAGTLRSLVNMYLAAVSEAARTGAEHPAGEAAPLVAEALSGALSDPLLDETAGT